MEADGPKQIPWADKSTAPVTALAFDLQGTLWAARQNEGLFSYDGHRWTHRVSGTGGLPYRTLAALRCDPKGGLWFLPGPDEKPQGLGFYDGSKVRLHNPPHALLPAASALDLDQQGNVWIGTPFDGVYQFRRNR
jgi:ligand-binding sensor domain-containing protein